MNPSNKEKFNILFIEASPGFGGSSACLYNVVKYLDKDKFNPVVFGYHNGPDVKKIKELAIATYTIEGARLPDNFEGDSQFFIYLSYLKELIRVEIPRIFHILNIIRKENIHLLHINNTLLANLAGVIAAQIADIPCVNHKRIVRTSSTKTERLFSRYVDAHIAISETVLNCQINLPTKRLVKIYDGIEIDEYPPKSEIRKEFGISSNKKIVGIISRIIPGKGHLDLIKAVPQIIKYCPDTVFLIVGSADGQRGGNRLLDQCKRQIRILNINNYVIFTGWRKDVKEILAALDVFVLPSTVPEGLGIANLEAMAMGKPTVVTNIGGAMETTLDKINGFVVSPGDIPALADKIITLLNDETLSASMGRNGRRLAMENYNITKQIKQLENLYLELLH